MKSPFLPLLLLPLLVTQDLLAQEDSISYQLFSGRILDDSIGIPVPHVHLWNESSRTGTTSGREGAFSLHVKDGDTVVFSAVGYKGLVFVIGARATRHAEIRMVPMQYRIGEVVVRRFRSYESFLHQVSHYEPPESEMTELKATLQSVLTLAAIEADQERANRDKLETGRFGYISPMGKGINRQQVFKEQMGARKKRQELIHSKYNRALVADVTKLEGEELTRFMAMCAFSEEFLYRSDLPTIMDSLYASLERYQMRRVSGSGELPRRP